MSFAVGQLFIGQLGYPYWPSTGEMFFRPFGINGIIHAADSRPSLFADWANSTSTDQELV